MRILLLSFICLAFAGAVSAQDIYWKVTLNRKTVLKGVDENDTATNRIQVKKADLTNNNIFKLEYYNKNEKSPKGAMYRSLAYYDPAGSPTVQLDSAFILMVENRDILKLLWTRKILTAYTWSSPSDPAMAAAIRIRRTRLFTIELID